MGSIWSYFNEPNFWWVLMGTAFLSAVASLVGTFTYLQRKSLMGDAIAHGILPGIAGGFLLAGEKNTLIIMIGAILWGILTVASIQWITKRTKLQPSSAMAIVLSSYFGLGMMLLTVVQSSGLPDASGVNAFLFGQAASILPEDLRVYSIFAVVVIVSLAAIYRPLTLLTFDRASAESRGFRVDQLDGVLSVLVVTATAIGIQSIGLILMAALLITPAAIARMWNTRLIGMLITSGIVAAIAAAGGTIISFSAPSMPTGPWIVVVLFAFTVVSVALSPHRGLIHRLRRRQNNQRIIRKENLIKRLYHHWESNQSTTVDDELLRESPEYSSDLLRRCAREGWLKKQGGQWEILPAGMREGRRITRAHRLWELYLSKKLRLKDDHVHPSAEIMEHLISEDIEEELLRTLGYPESDPHQRNIPYES